MLKIRYKKIKILAVLFFVVAVVSCNPIDEKFTCEEKVVEFRKKVKQKNFDEIYEQASSKFKQSVNKTDFALGLSNIADEIGEPDNFVLESWKVNSDIVNGITFVVLVFKPLQTKQVVLEEYVFIKENQDYLLFNYRYDHLQ